MAHSVETKAKACVAVQRGPSGGYIRRVSLRHSLPLRGATREPAGRRLSQLVSDTGGSMLARSGFGRRCRAAQRCALGSAARSSAATDVNATRCGFQSKVKY